MKTKLILSAAFIFAACSSAQSSPAPEQISAEKREAMLASNVDTAIFAGGCFWCIEADFEKLPGVIEAVSGYTGGHLDNPTYKQVVREDTGHYEAVKVLFDPAKVTYPELVSYFWRHVDPTDPNGQFCDKGDSYRSAIFARPDQISMARASKTEIESTKPFTDNIVTPVLPTATFYDAEGYHQDYYKKKPRRYKFYRKGCGRDARVKELWGN